MEVGVNGQVPPAPRPVEKERGKEPVSAPTEALLALDLEWNWFFAILKPVLVS